VAQSAPAPALKATPQPALAVPTPVDEASIAKAREALRQKMQQLEAQPPAPVGAAAFAPAVAKPGQAKPQEMAIKPEAKPTAVQAPKKPAGMKGALAFPPIQGPPPSISADKQQRLAELLRKYRAEEITPEEYHQQRAKVLSEP
jgi:hypothetical protein